MKNKFLKYFLLLNCFKLFLFISAEYVTASDNIDYSEFDTVKINNFKADPDYNYIYNKKKAFSLGEWLMDLLVNFLDSIIGEENSISIAPVILNILKWLCVILAVLFIIAQILGIKISQLFTLKQEISPNIFDEILEENINELDFEAMIKDNLKKAKFRYVIRLYYLMSLKNLQDKDFILWERYKTNKDYIDEIKDKNIKHDFSDITSLFNYTWYGNFKIDEEHCRSYIKIFKNFNNSLIQNRVA